MEALRRLGLTSYEIAVYRALVEHGRLSARDVAKHSLVPPTAVYPNLRSLASKGMVQSIRGEGHEAAYFEAIAPDVALPSFVERKNKEFSALASSALPELATLVNAKQLVPERQVVSLSYRPEASVAITKEFVRTAAKSLSVLGWRFRSSRSLHIPLADMKALVHRGVNVRIIVTGKEFQMREVVRSLVSAGIKVRYLPLDNFSIIVRDGVECKITLKRPRLAERLNIRIEDPDLAGFLGQYFDLLWKRAQPIPSSIPQPT